MKIDDPELMSLLEDCFTSLASCHGRGKMNGWWDTCALSVVRDLGNLLVENGRWERHPKGIGRRWFYRPVKAEDYCDGVAECEDWSKGGLNEEQGKR